MAQAEKDSFKNLKAFVSSVENSKTPLFYYFAVFFLAVTLRNFLEVVFSGAAFDALVFFHFYLFYFSLALGIAVMFNFFVKTPVKRALKAVLHFFPIIIFAPLIDAVIAGGAGLRMSYLFPGTHGGILLRFFTLGGNFYPSGITPGIKFVALVALLLIFFYFFSKTSRLLKSIFLVFFVYAAGFSLAFIPFFLKFISGIFGINLLAEWRIVLPNFYLVLVFIIGVIAVRVENKYFFSKIFFGKGFFRLFHYELMFFAGVFIAAKSGFFVLSGQNFFHFLLVPIAIFFSGIFSGIINDIADSKGGASKCSELAWGFLGLAIFYSLMAGIFSAGLILLGSAIFSAYSAPPLRLKRVPLLSKFLLACNSLILVLLGYSLAGGQIISFPSSVAFFFLVGVALAINFIDLKDYKRDKKAGIKTLPVLLGLKNSKILIGVFFVVAYALAYFIFSNPLLVLPLAFFAVLEFYLINRKNYDERLVFAAYLLSILLLIPFY